MSRFEITCQPLDLKLKQPFTISRGTKNVVNNVLVTFSDGEWTGFGEAAPNVRYNEDAENVKEWVQSIPRGFFDDIKTPEQLSAALDDFRPRHQTVRSAQCAVEMAWLDWWGKAQEQPLWKLWNAPKSVGPLTSFTIGLDEIDVMQQKVRNSAEYPIYKVKLGTDRDRDIIRALREVTDKPIRVDANEGWESLSEAKTMIDFLNDQNIEMVEQPMPANRFEDIKKLRQVSPLPFCADESFMGHEPLEKITQAFDIINIKLMKIGSLCKARDVIEKAQKYDLKVMIGCMIESSLANSAGALLSLWADYADLDGHLLIADDPFDGLQLSEGKHLELPNMPGLGVHLGS